MTGKDKFRITDTLRNRVLIVAFVIVALLHGLVLTEQTQRYLILIALGALTVALSAVYILMNWPLSKKNFYMELVLDGVILFAMFRFFTML